MRQRNNEYQAIECRLDKIDSSIAALKLQLTKQRTLIMSKAQELSTKLDELQETLVRVSTDIENQLKIITAPGTPDADVDAAITRIGVINDGLKQKATDLEADDAPSGGG